MHNFIVDTNFFFNLEIKSGFGESPKQVMGEFTKLAQTLKNSGKAQFFMPPRIVEELYTFLPANDPTLETLLTVVSVRSPDISQVVFGAHVFYKLVDDIRTRSYRGMKVAEEVVDQAVRDMQTRIGLSTIDYQKALGEHLTKFRERYRQATRVKFLDSVADLDLIVLAKELDGTLITADEGVLAWGREFGVKEIPAGLVQKHLLGL